MARGINGIGLRMDVEPIPTLMGKVNDITVLALDYFSRLTGENYPMPDIRVIDSPIVGKWRDNPSILVLGRKANKVTVLHELVHHLRGCNGISNTVYAQNPYTEEMATQFVSATVFSNSMRYPLIVSDVYSDTPRRAPNFRLDLMAFQEAANAIRTIIADRMDLGSENTRKTFLSRAVYGPSMDRGIPRHIDGFKRFEYLKYPLGKAFGVLVYSRFLDIDQTSKAMLLLTQDELTDLILSIGNFERWKTRFFTVVSHLKDRLGLKTS